MGRVKLSQEDKIARAAQRAEIKASKLRTAEEVKRRREGQLDQAQKAIRDLEQRMQTEGSNAKVFAGLTSHLDGFYEEIDKLTKGKSMLEVTTLVVEHTNNIIRDAKSIISDDAYMTRVKEFVPAGDNPVYPDVLVTLRTVRQALSRFAEGRTNSQKKTLQRLTEAKTIAAALRCHLEENRWPSKEDVAARLETGIASNAWFFETDDGEFYFDLERLDGLNLGNYFSEG